MIGCKPCTTPIEANHQLEENDNERLIYVGRYRRLVGRLIYLFLTHPDITYAVSVISQFMHAPTQDHLEATYTLRYLKSCPRKGILYRRHDHHLVEVYVDADWA